MYENGKGVSKLPILAYALYSISANIYSESNNNANSNKFTLEAKLKPSQIDAAKRLMAELELPNNFTKALEAYLKKAKAK